LSGVNLTGLDTTKATNLQPKAVRTAGPNLRELAKVANASKKFTTSIELELGKDEQVVLHPSLILYGNRPYTEARYSHTSPNENLGSYVQAPTFEQGMLNLTDLWSRGTPRFDTVKVAATKCPLSGKELQDLAIAAWHEACGLSVPSAEELEKAVKQSAAERASLLETMLAEL